MMGEINSLVESITNPHLKALCSAFFVDDYEFMEAFRTASGAKSVHHAFMGGLAEHTLGVAHSCDAMAALYPILDRDLMVTCALLHDIGKLHELTPLPVCDYTDEGNLMGHIFIGARLAYEKMEQIEGFPATLREEVIHCILAHHGELEFGSPKKPCIPEALALHMADNLDAKMQMFAEAYDADEEGNTWLGFHKYLGVNIRRTHIDEA